MKNKFYIPLLFKILLLNSCGSENPVKTETGFGKVYITSNVEQAEIFIDGDFSGLYTPDTLELLSVQHLIKVRQNGYFSEEREISVQKDKFIFEIFTLVKNNLTKNVLLEIFSNSDCDSCRNFNDMFDNLKNSYLDKLLILNYPARFPNPNDPMYLGVTEHVDSRMGFYNNLEIPTFFLDGSTFNLQSAQIDKQLNEETKLELTVKDSLTQGDGMTIDVFVDVHDLDGLDFNQLVLIIAILEKEIYFNTPPGLNGETKFSYILRGMVPDALGNSLSAINKKGRAKFAEFKLLNPKWKKENLMVIAFVQELNTNRVLQAAASD